MTRNVTEDTTRPYMQLATTPARPAPKKIIGRLADLAIIAQPLLCILIYVSLVLDAPPIWLSWALFLSPSYLKWRRGEPLMVRTPLDIPIAILSMGMVVGLAIAPDKAESFKSFQGYLVAVVTYYLGVTTSLTRPWYWALGCAVIVVAALIVAVFTFLPGAGPRIVPYNSWIYRAFGAVPWGQGLGFFGPNILGAITGVAFPCFAALAFLTARGRIRTVAGIAAALMLFLLAMSASTSGAVAALAGLAFLLFLWKPWAPAVVALALLGALWWLVSAWHPASYLAPLLPLNTLALRFDIWEKTLSLLRDSPWLGLGLGAWFERYNDLPTASATLHPHNAFLQLYSDVGVIGAGGLLVGVAAVAVLAWCLRKDGQHNAWRGPGIAVTAALVAFGANSLFEVMTVFPVVARNPAGLAISGYWITLPLVWVLAVGFSAAYLNSSRPLPRWLTWSPWRRAKPSTTDPSTHPTPPNAKSQTPDSKCQ